MALTGSIRASVNLLETLTGDLETASAQLNTAFGWDVANGTGANQGNLQWSDTRPVGSGATDIIDVSGTLTGLTGAKVFVKLKAILVYAAAANTVNITVVQPAAGVPIFGTATDSIVLKPGGVFMVIDPSAAGMPVTPTSFDLIHVIAGAAAVSYTIVLVGTNA